MKTLQVEKNRAFLHYEMKDITCEEILNESQKELRFDMKYLDGDVDIKKWRCTIKHNTNGVLVIEFRDYEGNKQEFALSPWDTVLDASTIALRQIWAVLESNPDKYPVTQAMPKIVQ